MLASKALKYKRRVLLSCPVKKNKYQPDFENIGEVYSIRTRMDLIILADGSGQRFTDKRIKECRLKKYWFGHSATHKKKIWKKYNLEDFINNRSENWKEDCGCQ